MVMTNMKGSRRLWWANPGRAEALRRIAPFGAQVHSSVPVGDEDGGGGDDGERSEEQQQHQQQPPRASLSAGAQERDRFQRLNQMGIGRWKIFAEIRHCLTRQLR